MKQPKSLSSTSKWVEVIVKIWSETLTFARFGTFGFLSAPIMWSAIHSEDLNLSNWAGLFEKCRRSRNLFESGKLFKERREVRGRTAVIVYLQSTMRLISELGFRRF